MTRVIPTKRSLLDELARAGKAWTELNATVEFKLALCLFLVFAIGLAVLRFVR